MADITVTGSDRGSLEYDVAVQDGGRTSSYQVSVPPDLPGRLGGVAPHTLVRESFAFLLEREPPSSILSKFSLSVVPRYFPEYLDEMRSRLS